MYIMIYTAYNIVYGDKKIMHKQLILKDRFSYLGLPSSSLVTAQFLPEKQTLFTSFGERELQTISQLL